MRLVSAPVLPDDDEPIGELLERVARRSRRKRQRKVAETWHPLTFNEAEPFGILVFGDPHLDDDKCNWDLLQRDVSLTLNTPGLYAACVGDATNNWTGRLFRLYAEQETGKNTARRLARWFLKDAGIPWVWWNVGNHDEWQEGDAILGLIADGAVYMPGWRAQIEIRAAGQRWRIDSRHDFPGSSIYNKTHGPARAAMFSGGAADVLLCGHRHHYGYQNFEVGEDGRFCHALRLGSYKWNDKHAERLGFSQSEIPSALIVFDPQARSAAGRVMVYADTELGARVLTSLRSVPRPKCKPKAKRKPTRK